LIDHLHTTTNVKGHTFATGFLAGKVTSWVVSFSETVNYQIFPAAERRAKKVFIYNRLGFQTKFGVSVWETTGAPIHTNRATETQQTNAQKWRSCLNWPNFLFLGL